MQAIIKNLMLTFILIKFEETRLKRPFVSKKSALVPKFIIKLRKNKSAFTMILNFKKFYNRQVSK